MTFWVIRILILTVSLAILTGGFVSLARHEARLAAEDAKPDDPRNWAPPVFRVPVIDPTPLAHIDGPVTEDEIRAALDWIRSLPEVTAHA